MPEPAVAARETGAPIAAEADLSTLEIRYARRLRLEQRGGAVLVSVRPPWAPVGERSRDGWTRYLLVSRDGEIDPAVTADEGLRLVRVPVERLVVTSTTELGHLVALGASNRVVGFPQPRLMVDPGLRARAEAGTLRSIGAGATGIDAEALLAAEPEVLIADFASQSQLDELAAIERAGVPVLLAPTFLESTPLGRAEWGVLWGLLVGEGEAARARFSAVEASYRSLAERVESAVAAGGALERPRVLVGGPWNEVWHVPGADSYPARLLADAGAAYVWEAQVRGAEVRGAEVEGAEIREAPAAHRGGSSGDAPEDPAEDPETVARAGAMPLDLERVYERAGDAPVWLWPGAWRSLDEIRAADPRLGRFAAVGSAPAGRVVAADRRLLVSGGNDFWESAPGRPDLVLADLVRLLHPSLLPEHELVYHRVLSEVAPSADPHPASESSAGGG